MISPCAREWSVVRGKQCPNIVHVFFFRWSLPITTAPKPRQLR